MTERRDEEEWLRIQCQMAHHDIWWVKAQQMNAAYWTLLLRGALTGVGHLMAYDRANAKTAALGTLLGAFLSIPGTSTH